MLVLWVYVKETTPQPASESVSRPFMFQAGDRNTAKELAKMALRTVRQTPRWNLSSLIERLFQLIHKEHYAEAKHIVLRYLYLTSRPPNTRPHRSGKLHAYVVSIPWPFQGLSGDLDSLDESAWRFVSSSSGPKAMDRLVTIVLEPTLRSDSEGRL